jgi:CBS domain-containing protein
MNSGEICKQNVVTIREFDELSSAARLMRERHVGYLVVVEPQPLDARLKPIGVLTDRDIVVSVLAKDADIRALRVGDVMTRQPVVVHEEKSVGFALKEMRRIGVRRLPVVGAGGHLVGVLSLDDVIDALSKEFGDVSSSIRSELQMESALRS